MVHKTNKNHIWKTFNIFFNQNTYGKVVPIIKGIPWLHGNTSELLLGWFIQKQPSHCWKEAGWKYVFHHMGRKNN